MRPEARTGVGATKKPRIVTIPAKPKPLAVPLDLQVAGQAIARLGDEGDEILAALTRAASVISSAAENARATHGKIMGNEMVPELRRLSDARRRVHEIADKAHGTVSDVSERVDGKLRELELAVLPKAPTSAPEMVYAGEVRAAVAKMPAGERVKRMRDAVERADEAFIAAIVHGSPELTGMTRTEVMVVKDMWSRRHHLPTVERTRRLRNALSHLDRLSRSFTKWAGNINADANDRIDKAEAAEVAAREALEPPQPGGSPRWAEEEAS